MKEKRQEEPTMQTYVDSRVNDMHKYLLAYVNESQLNLSHQTSAVEAQLDRRIKALEQDMIERIHALRREQTVLSTSSKEAVLKAEASVDRRLTSMNEFRGALSDQATHFLPRETFDSTLEAWTQWRSVVDKQLSENVGKEVGQAHISDRVFSVLTLLIALAAMGAAIIIAIGHP